MALSIFLYESRLAPENIAYLYAFILKLLIRDKSEWLRVSHGPDG
jgi:hypothetical protein